LGFDQSSSPSLAEQLREHVSRKELLLVVDNAEHLVDELAPLLEDLLSASPDLRVMATSRTAIGISGEVRYEVPPLTVPPEDGPLTIDKLLVFEAPRLFVDRSPLPTADVATGGIDCESLGTVCRRLDGLPLAIELAAARTRVLSLAQLAERLDERFALLSGGPRSAPDRHRTILATMDWSFDLLDEADRVLLRRLAVFRGGFRTESATGVCAGRGLPETEIAPALQSLVDKSLVYVVSRTETPRFGMLQTTMDFAATKLSAAGEDEDLRRKQLSYFHTLAHSAKDELMGPEQVRWLDVVGEERANFVTAIEWALTEGGEPATALEMSTALRWYWYIRGGLAEARYWLERALEAAEGATGEQQGEGLNALAVICMRQGDLPAAKSHLDSSLAKWQEEGDERWQGLVLGNLGLIAREQYDFSGACRCFEESARILDGLGDSAGSANALLNLAHSETDLGELGPAERHIEHALDLYSPDASDWVLATSRALLGMVRWSRGEDEDALALYSEALEAYESIGDRSAVADLELRLAETERAWGDSDAAVQHAESALNTYLELGLTGAVPKVQLLMADIQIQFGERDDLSDPHDLLVTSLLAFRDCDSRPGIAYALGTSGELAAVRGDFERAALLWGAAEARLTDLGYVKPAQVARQFAGYLDRAAAALGAERLEELMSEGSELSTEQAIDLALEE
jgi:non-specific serine/threonine protein kinase